MNESLCRSLFCIKNTQLAKELLIDFIEPVICIKKEDMFLKIAE